MTALDVKKDGSQKLYMLFAPGKQDGAVLSKVENFNDVNFSMSTPLTLEQAKALSAKTTNSQ